MKIGIDGNSLPRNKTGIGIYTENLLNEFANLDHENQFFIFCNFWRDYLVKKEKINIINQDNFHYKIRRFPETLFRFSTQKLNTKIERYLGNLDIFHSPGFHFVPTKKAKLIVTIHDLVTQLFPEFFPDKLVKSIGDAIKKSLNNAHGIIFDSNATKNDCFNIFRENNQVSNKVIYLGVNRDFFKPIEINQQKKFKQNFKLPDKYILIVGTIEPRKNHFCLIKAFEKIASKYPDLYLVIAGMKGWLYRETFSMIENSSVKERILYLDYIQRNNLPNLYSSAEIFIFPSLYEGFGLPVLEAQACGVPVITSHCGSLKEVTQNSAEIINPENHDNLSESIFKILDNQELKLKLIQDGLENTNRFTWHQTAVETLQFYNKIIQES